MRKNHPLPSVLSVITCATTALAGCAGPSQVASRAAQPAAPEVSHEPAVQAADVAPAAAPRTTRRVGDFMVHMIGGSFRKHPALLTERVTARENDAWIIEYRVEDTTGVSGLRVAIDDNGQVKRVTRLIDESEAPGTLADYEALLAMTSVTPDSNEGLTASTQGTCTVGPSELDCETKSYRILLGDKEASMGITASAAIPALDLAGEITAADGTVIYRSELLERGNESESKDASISLLMTECSARAGARPDPTSPPRRSAAPAAPGTRPRRA
jgi:hypothetical protein